MTPTNARVREVSRAIDVNGNTIEPVTLADMKNYLKVPSTITADDALIRDMISSARQTCEKALSMTFIQTTWELVIDFFPPGNGAVAPIIYSYLATGNPCYPGAAGWDRLGIRFPYPPLISVDSISYRDFEGVTQSLDPSPSAGNVRIVAGTPGQMIPVLGRIFPITKPEIGGVTVQWTAGISADGTGSILAPARSAIRYLVGQQYTGRSGGIALDQVAMNLLSPLGWGGTYA